MKSARRPRTWFEEEEEVTVELYPLVALVRTAPVVVDVNTPIAEAARLLVENRIPALIVIGRERQLEGIVTRTDVLRLGDRPDATASDAMSSFVFALPDEATVEQAAALMALEGVGQVVVTSADGELVGMVSALDIARHCAIRAGYLAAG
ncbi:MAG TPA: CBS domain-containing protein [Kofleriaceae bacterium]|jgi:CBS domain-containing protein